MVTQLGRGVYWLDLGWPSPFGSNAYLVDDGSVTLIDSGLPLNQSGIRDEIGAAGFSIAEIDRVLITHYDLDHIGGLARLVPELDAPVFVGARDLELMEGRWDPPLLHHKGLFHRGLRRLYRMPSSLSYRAVEDRDQIGGFVAFAAPGHNPGHVVYAHESLRVVLFGDLVWEDDGELTTSIWFDSYNLAEVRASIGRLGEELSPFEIVGVGHGTPVACGGYALFERLVRRVAED